MLMCSFALNGQRFSKLIVDTLRVDAFSGNGTHRNNPASVGVRSHGPLPLGMYYIVDRESGGTLGGLRDWVTGRDEWFALYRDDGSIDDRTFVHSVERGQFRLHPLGPARRSDGCVTVQHASDFARVRALLRGHGTTRVGQTTVMAYGTLWVHEPGRVLDPYHRARPPESAVA